MPVWNANIRSFNSYEESSKLYNSYFITSIYICISFLPEQWKACAKLTQPFLFHFLIYAHSTSTLYLQVELKGIGMMSFSLSFYVFIFSKSSSLIQESKWARKDMIGFLGHLCFLRIALLLHLKHILVQIGSPASPGCLCPHFLSHRCNTFTQYLLWVSLNSHTCRPTTILHSRGIANAIC